MGLGDVYKRQYHIWPILLFTVYYLWGDGQFYPILTLPPIWSLGCPQSDQIFKYGENDCHHQISDMKYNIWSILLVTDIIYEKMVSFPHFDPYFTHYVTPRWAKYSNIVKVIIIISFLMLDNISELIYISSLSFICFALCHLSIYSNLGHFAPPRGPVTSQ